jgi:L-aspartate oxidase
MLGYFTERDVNKLSTIIVDYIVIGTGIAGLSCALGASKHGNVALLTKGDFFAGNTPLAQGGIACALAPGDSPEYHYQDTLTAGAGGCNQDTVNILVHEGIDRVLELKNMGVPFDCKDDGSLDLAKEGAHSKSRVVSAMGDSTGRAIAETLVKEVKQISNIKVYEYTMVTKLLVKNKECFGVAAVNQFNQQFTFLAKATVLAAGGCGQVYLHTTNSKTCTGDGFALAYQAGAELVDMEFVQFHPTGLALIENPRILISEAVRGEGALLINSKGRRFMQQHHPMAELAPRDVVARGIFEELAADEKVFLDTTPIGQHFVKRFPYITAACRARGLDPVNNYIPVTPVAHFMMGGVKTDHNGQTCIKRLFACGEVACTGVHGANRLASNSLLEGVVFGHRVARSLINYDTLTAISLFNIDKSNTDYAGNSFIPVNEQISNQTYNRFSKPHSSVYRNKLRSVMWQKVGLVRTEKQLSDALKLITKLEKQLPHDDYETYNMVLTAKLITEAALKRQESRGSHYRKDFPYALPEKLYHQVLL